MFNIIAVVAFLWPVTGMGPSLWSRPIEDWTAPRMWCIAVFLSLFFFNEPFYVVRVWVPDAQDGLRSFNSWMTTACVAFEIGFIMFFACPPEGGACSSWIKHGFSHSLRQRLRGVTEKWFGRVG